MTINVTDARSNPNDQISHAVAVIARDTGLPSKRVLEEGKRISSNGIVHQTKHKGETAYSKDDFYAAQKGKILSFVKNPRKLKNFPTKTTPRPLGEKTQTFRLRTQSIQVTQVTVDDLDSFLKVNKIAPSASPIAMSERRFKAGVMRVLGESGKFQDWGGERNDLCTTRLRFGGKRRTAAFAFKGKGLKKKLTPSLMGKNGDQIQRLFQTPAEVFLLQYWSQIDDSVLEQIQTHAKVRSYADGKRIYYGIIDGQDSARLIQAYPRQFEE